MFRTFERLLDPTAVPPETPPPAGAGPRSLAGFYWHFLRQVRFLVLALFGAGLLVALVDVSIPAIIGQVVGLATRADRASLFALHWRGLAGMALVLMVLRPAAILLRALISNQAINPGLTNMVRWQNHWHVVRQSWTFFQNDFAGRIANRVMQTGPALRESVVMRSTPSGTSSSTAAARCCCWAAPTGGWRCRCWCGSPATCVMLRVFVPRLRDRSRRMSEVRSALTGRVVDSYTNILTVKLFARARDEDAFVREAIDEHTVAFRDQTRMITRLHR